MVFDTTGVRVYESGEWEKEKYGSRRKWKEIHVRIDLKTKEIVYSKAINSQIHACHL